MLPPPLFDRCDPCLAATICPVCGGTIGASPGGRPVRCLDCGWMLQGADGVTDLRPPGWTAPQRPRRYGGAEDLSFYAFFRGSLRTDAYRDTTLEDEIYTLLGWLDPQPDALLLILGAEQGEISRLVSDALPTATVVACTDDHTEARQAAVEARDGGFPRLLNVCCDLGRPPFRPGAFAHILHFGLAHGLPDPNHHWDHVRRLLPRGGKLAGVTLARSTLPDVARDQERHAAELGVRFLGMQDFAHGLLQRGWDRFRHEQPSHWMARFTVQKP